MNRLFRHPRTTVGLAILWMATLAILIVEMSASIPSAKAAPAAAPATAPASAPSLAQQRLQVVKYVNVYFAQMIKQGIQPSVDDQCLWSRRQMETEHDAATTDADRATALHDHMKRMQDLEASCKQLYSVGKITYLNLMTVTYHRIEAEQLAAENG